MIARKLKPEEIWRSELNMAVAFEGSFDWEKEREKAKTAEADPKADHWGAFPEGEAEPTSSLVMNYLKVRFDGHIVGLGGVGGVATLPAARRGGGVRACMKAAFRDLYDRGFLFSGLYPFNSAYYRQFGFEVGTHSVRWDIPLRELRLPPSGGSVRQLFPGDDLSPLLTVYNGMYGNVNLSAVRETYDEALTKDNLLDQKRYIFLWEDEAGEPGAFLICGRDGETLNCRTDFSQRNGLLFRDRDGLRALLYFVQKAFPANFEDIRFSVPEYVDVRTALPEVGGAKGGRLSLNNFMLRVVSAEKALKLCRCKGEGELAAAVSDPLLEENNGTFRISFAPGRENRVERTKDAPDISLGVGELGQLLCGVKTAADLPWMPGASVCNEAAPLELVFYRKPCHIHDLF